MPNLFLSSGDMKIVDYARKTGCVVVTEGGQLISRLRASGIEIITIEIDEKAEIIHEKLRKKYGQRKCKIISLL